MEEVFLAKVEKWKSVIDFVGIKQNNLMESNPGDGKACKLKAFVALPEIFANARKNLGDSNGFKTND